jgi:hypothetical protein
MSRRFIITMSTILIIIAIASVAVFLAKGYRFSPKTGSITGTGILSITSAPDQASVFLDGHLTTATNANINSLVPKEYDVKITKEGFIDWEKKVQVKEGLVSEIKATLYRSLPSVYPLTYTGAQNVALSPDTQQIAFVVPIASESATINKKGGLWVWSMSEKPISFARAAEPHQIAISSPGSDYSHAKLTWSPESNQILATFPDKQLLLDVNNLNDPARDITAISQATTKTWGDDQKTKDSARLQTIADLNVRKVASSSAVLNWSPDETKFLYCQTNCDLKKGSQAGSFQVMDLVTGKSYPMPVANYYTWTSDSDHIVMTEVLNSSEADAKKDNTVTQAKLSVVEFDGVNKAEIYGGNFDPYSVFVWPDGSRLAVISSYPTATGSMPNLYGINLK